MAVFEYRRGACLLAHGALVGVAGALVVVGVGDEAGTHAQQSERGDFHVCRLRRDVPAADEPTSK